MTVGVLLFEVCHQSSVIYLPFLLPDLHFFVPNSSPPAQSDKTADSERSKSEIDNAGIQSPGRLLAELLRRARADGTLRLR